MQNNSNFNADGPLEQRVAELLGEMTLDEKIGQMAQANIGDGVRDEHFADQVRAGRVGSFLNVIEVGYVNELQRIAVEESRLGIPLLIGRDVIHGFHTVMPIPLGQAASFDPAIVRDGAAVAAREAATAGINWTFAPMIDVSRDPRWGRIAESFGEDPTLMSIMGAAAVEGFQSADAGGRRGIAACAKHFAGYGAVESGRDYATTNVPPNEMHNVYLPPFKAAVDAGALTVMTSFSDIDGIPATANEYLLRDVLRRDWQFDGLVVSDWDSVRQLAIHGLTANDTESAVEALTAGVDMEMFGDAYSGHLERLINEGVIDVGLIDQAVANILRVKLRLGLFEQPYTDTSKLPPTGSHEALAVARRAAEKSIVLLKNDSNVLPLASSSLRRVAVIGPMADEPRQQLGTWIFDGDPALSKTPLTALRERLAGVADVVYERGLETTRSPELNNIDRMLDSVAAADVALLFIGEEAILSGEAHSRADIGLPGAQAELVQRLRAVDTPLVAVILAGRPLVLSDVIEELDAVLFAWHPGSMAGPAIADLLLGDVVPSAKLPATFPRMSGQVPIYHSQKNTGKPPSEDSVVLIDDIDPGAHQLSTGMTAYHLDAGFTPLFPFGFGLSYTEFEYSNIEVAPAEPDVNDTLTVTAEVSNVGAVDGTEVAQLYVRDLVGNVTRPVRELKAFERVTLAAGQRRRVSFEIKPDDLGFYNRRLDFVTEPGDFQVFVGGDSNATLMASFRLEARRSEAD